MTTPSQKAEFPPLLPVGFHPMSVQDLIALCVTRFPLSPTRPEIMTHLKWVIRRLSKCGIKTGELWIDGSFLTEKLDPADADIVLWTEGAIRNFGTAKQQAGLEWLSSNLKYRYGLLCDSYVTYHYPVGHPQYWVGEIDKAYWMNKWGLNRTEQYYTGVAVIALN